MIVFFSSVDSSSHAHLNFQKILLDAVFQNIDAHDLRDFHLSIPFTDTNIQYTEPAHHRPPIFREAVLAFDQQNLVEFRLFQWMFKGNLRIDFLPHSVHVVGIDNCSQEFELHCRRLPRDAEKVMLCGNRIFGTLDLQNLPVNLVVLNLLRNNLYGGFSLVDLPEKLEVLNLWENKGIGQDIVLYRNLPKCLSEIRLVNVKEVRPTEKKYRVHDESIFVIE
uniref:Uncharacterized protein n=1 Tax=Paramoeba aestuarina TaxID=180227 RepID=A0A7S4L0F9_9EUKA|mmetsp:Transcript_29359/g.45369  ORF Transcript_29359/g.45369 Transcript_29359/m.45369 type:complete len:221 (+) Transcript_29359:25-687(+)